MARTRSEAAAIHDYVERGVPPRQRRRSPHRERAIASALEVLAELGAAAVTVRSVATHSGVSVGSLTHYFPTRGALLHHAFTDHAESVVCRVDNAFGIGAEGAAGAAFGQRGPALVTAEMKLLSVRDDVAATSYDRIRVSLTARLRGAGMSLHRAERMTTLLEGAALDAARTSDQAAYRAVVGAEISAILRAGVA